MRPVPERAEWILRALTSRRGSENLRAPAHRQPVNLRSMLKAVLFPFYRLIRPVVRPPLWRLRTFMTQPLATEYRALGPGIGGGHVDDADGRNARPRRLDPKQVRGLAALHAAPEFLFGRQLDLVALQCARGRISRARSRVVSAPSTPLNVTGGNSRTSDRNASGAQSRVFGTPREYSLCN
jgi:hypothetical protein